MFRNYVFHTNASYLAFIFSVLFLADFSYTRQFNNPYLGQYWTLAVEEQFYFIFPFLFKKSFKLYFASILCIVLLLPLIITIEFLLPGKNTPVYFITHFLIKFQGIATGCLFSVPIFKNKLNWSSLAKNRMWLNPVIILLVLFRI